MKSDTEVSPVCFMLSTLVGISIIIMSNVYYDIDTLKYTLVNIIFGGYLFITGVILSHDNRFLKWYPVIPIIYIILMISWLPTNNTPTNNTLILTMIIVLILSFLLMILMIIVILHLMYTYIIRLKAPITSQQSRILKTVNVYIALVLIGMLTISGIYEWRYILATNLKNLYVILFAYNLTYLLLAFCIDDTYTNKYQTNRCSLFVFIIDISYQIILFTRGILNIRMYLNNVITTPVFIVTIVQILPAVLYILLTALLIFLSLMDTLVYLTMRLIVYINPYLRKYHVM
jgi:hypothetical protein